MYYPDAEPGQDQTNIFGSGYDSAGGTSAENYHVTSFYWKDPVTATYWIPPTIAVPAIPAIPPTPTQVNRYTNEGWNTSARSVAQLTPGNYFRFSVMSGVSGAFLGIGPDGLDGQGISKFTHAIICDRAGVHIQENNVQVALLKNRQYASSLLRIHRHVDGHIVFVSTTEQETLVYTSAVPYSVLVPTFVYGILYSSGDQILSAEYKTGIVSYGAA